MLPICRLSIGAAYLSPSDAYLSIGAAYLLSVNKCCPPIDRCCLTIDRCCLSIIIVSNTIDDENCKETHGLECQVPMTDSDVTFKLRGFTVFNDITALLKNVMRTCYL